MASSIKKEYRIVLIGKTGMGKSSLGNSILSCKDEKNHPFLAETAGSAVTKKCQRGFMDLKDKNATLIVIDTPGLFDTDETNENTITEIIKCVALAAPGPNLFVFLLNPKRISREDINSIELLKSTFGKDVLKYSVVVFTRKDCLDTNIQEFVKKSLPYLKNLIFDCGGRYAALCTKKARAKNYNKGVKDVLDLITNTVESFDYRFYTEKMFEVADTIIEKEVETRLEKEPKREKEEIKEEVKSDIEKKDSSTEPSGFWGEVFNGVKAAIPGGLSWALGAAKRFF